MKWLGQYVQSFTARFRHDVYLEALTTSTETDMLVVDSNGKVTKRAIDAITVDVSDFMTNGADNYVLTATGADAINAEANLQFNGSALNVIGVADISPANDAGAAALTIDNDDVDQIALDIDAENTTANIIDIDAADLTTANAIKITRGNSAGGVSESATSSTIHIDQDNSSTVSSQEFYNVIHLDYDTDTEAAGAQFTRGVYVDINDTSPASGVVNAWKQKHGFYAKISKDNTYSNNFHAGFYADISGGDATYQYGTNPEFYASSIYKSGNVGFFSKGEAFSLVATAGDDPDYFGIRTTTHGATKLVTADYAGAAANFEIEADGAITLDAEGDINLEVGGDDLTIDTNNVTITSADSGFPVIGMVTNNTDKDKSGELRFKKDAADTEDGENLGKITWYGEDEGNNNTQFAGILGEISESDDGTEAGRLTFSVAESDGANTAVTAGLVLEGEHATDGQIDVTIAAGAASDTTIAGNLTVTSDLTVNGDTITFESANADDPAVIIRNTSNDNQAARLQMRKNRTDTQADNDRVAELDFMGEDASGNLQQYGKLMVQVLEADHGSETGIVKIQAAEYDGTLTNGLQVWGGTADGVVNVTLGAGVASTTTVGGELVVTTGTPTTVSSGSQVTLGVPMIARRTITQGEMNALHTTPIPIIPAQGANLIAIPTHCTIFVDRASTNSGTGDLVFGYDSPASFQNAIFYSRRFNNSVTTDMHYEIGRYLGKWGTSLTAGVDTVFDVHLTGAASNNCFTSVDVYVTYYVIDRS
tara:strand:- start:2772 stop:5066 length:2295 start_codon:yes stop_codon:yes gene_type:complete